MLQSTNPVVIRKFKYICKSSCKNVLTDGETERQADHQRNSKYITFTWGSLRLSPIIIKLGNHQVDLVIATFNGGRTGVPL